MAMVSVADELKLQKLSTGSKVSKSTAFLIMSCAYRKEQIFMRIQSNDEYIEILLADFPNSPATISPLIPYSTCALLLAMTSHLLTPLVNHLW